MKSAITISIDRALLRACRATACAARRTLSAQIEQWIDEKLALSAAARSSTAPPAPPPRECPGAPAARRAPRALPDQASPAAAQSTHPRKEVAA
jgi:hypothetical protein